MHLYKQSEQLVALPHSSWPHSPSPRVVLPSLEVLASTAGPSSRGLPVTGCVSILPCDTAEQGSTSRHSMTWHGTADICRPWNERYQLAYPCTLALALRVPLTESVTAHLSTLPELVRSSLLLAVRSMPPLTTSG
jgi:hypothetical protein